MRLPKYAPVAALAALLSNAAFCADQKPEPLSAAEVFQRSAPAIVAIDCLGDNRTSKGTAAGFLISSDGKIATSLETIRSCLSVNVRLSNGTAYESANVMDYEKSEDLAVLRIQASSLPALALGDSNELAVGEVVYSIRSPDGPQSTLQEGSVSSFRDIPGLRLVQVTTSIDAGNAGGPILNDQARVVGIAALKAGGESRAVAIPINYAKRMMDGRTEIPFAQFAAAMATPKQFTPPQIVLGASPPTPANGSGGGLGPGRAGGGVFRVGGGVDPPVLVSKTEPQYSEEARKAGIQGTVLLYVQIDPTGKATNIRVVKSLTRGLDENAIEAVEKWKFKPGAKNGDPVTVEATIEVNFRLLSPWKITRTEFTVEPGVSKPVLNTWVLPRPCKTGGKVTIAFDVSTDGTPGNIRLIQTNNTPLADAALAAIQSWQFQPGMKGGNAVPVSGEMDLSCVK
jgi:TonB family protein